MLIAGTTGDAPGLDLEGRPVPEAEHLTAVDRAGKQGVVEVRAGVFLGRIAGPRQTTRNNCKPLT